MDWGALSAFINIQEVIDHPYLPWDKVSMYSNPGFILDDALYL